MTFAAASLADGQLPNSVAALYTSSAKTIIKSITLLNTNATPQTMNIYVTRNGSTRRRHYRFSDVAQHASIDVLTDGVVLSLSAGDTLDGDTTTAAVVDYTVTGATE